METKKTTPILTVVLYIIGIVFLAVSAFMLYAGVVYTKGYLASYDMTFADMWSNSLQYVIEKFVPYLAYGIISIGLGKAIKEFKNATKPEIEIPEIKAPEVELPESLLNQSEAIDSTLSKIEDVKQALNEFQVVTNIKLEEMEKRESFRLKETKEIINGEFDIHMANRAAAEALILKYLGADDDEIEEVAVVAEPEDIEVEEAGAETDVEAEEADVEAVVEGEAEDEEAEAEGEVVEAAEDSEEDEEAETEEGAEATEVIEVRHQVRRVRRFLK